MDMSRYYYPQRSFLSWNPYDLHKYLINTRVLTKKGSTSLLVRDSSRDKTDFDVIREHHKFLWDEDEEPSTWEERLAKKYYEKLFKEFCITDLSRYKENKFAMRWQTEQELVTGKGQFVCGNKKCKEREFLRTWEVNFAYKENGEKKNALVKLRLCPSCSKKLNYSHKRREIKRPKKKLKRLGSGQRSERDASAAAGETGSGSEGPDVPSPPDSPAAAAAESSSGRGDEEIWKAPLEDVEEVSREDEFEKYLEHLLL